MIGALKKLSLALLLASLLLITLSQAEQEMDRPHSVQKRGSWQKAAGVWGKRQAGPPGGWVAVADSPDDDLELASYYKRGWEKANGLWGWSFDDKVCGLTLFLNDGYKLLSNVTHRKIKKSNLVVLFVTDGFSGTIQAENMSK